jgi:hypothetical protein
MIEARHKGVAILAAAAVALTAPVALANQGGIPQSTKPCPSKAQGHGPKKPQPNNKGKKCGFKH